VRLPEGEFTDGARPVLVAVALSVGEGGRRKDIVFFDDDRYIAGQDGQMGGLEQSLAAHAARHPDAELVIQADRDVPHGTVVRLMNMAREVGIHRVSLALRERE
jgi:biopolymer transport protein ExbD